jgi:hypothetical protein
MINIPEKELLDSLKQGYLDFEASHNKEERTNIKGWCNALEAIAFNYASELKEEIITIRNSIVVKRPNIKDDINLDTPSIMRKKGYRNV